MGFLDSLTHGLPGPFSGPGRTQRRGNRLATEGESAGGTLTGIRVWSDAEDATVWEFAAEVRGPTGAFRAACRQWPASVRDQLRIGMALDVRHRDGEIAVVWDADGLPGGWRPVRDVPDGIDDRRLPSSKGEPAEATLVGWRRTFTLGMERAERGVRLRIDGHELDWRKIWVPEYAGHLLEPGTTWPVTRAGDRITVDWLGALARHGYGAHSPLPDPTDEPDDSPGIEERAQSFAAKLIGADTSVAGTTDDPQGVSFETWVAVSAGLVRDRVKPAEADDYAQSHGVAPGAWTSAEAAWKGRMMSDWQLGARYGEAFQQARKRKR